jgi:type IV pilus assembly protein PilM
MAKRNDSWGIEVGANAIKAMRLVRSGGNAPPELVEYDVIPFDQILTTPEIDVEAAVREKLEVFLSRHDVDQSSVVMSVPGHMAFARFAKLPPVDQKKIPQVVKFEAQQQIPFPIEQVEWDYQVFRQGQDSQLGVGIFAMNKERVGQLLSNYGQLDMTVDALTLSPLAVYNAFHYDAEQKEGEGTIYMDIGAMSTDVIIVENGGIWLRTLPIGGNHFTEALVRAFKLSHPKAEKLKREAGTSKYARQIFQAMRPVFADLVQEIQRSLGYYQSLNRESNLTRLVGIGSTFRLPGLRKFLKQQLQLEVERPSGFNRLQIEGKQESEFAGHALNMATAYGLALQGLGQETVTANLMPWHTLQMRMWRGKQPWFAAAAACLVLAAGVAGGRYFLFNSQWQSIQSETDPIVERVTRQADQLVGEWEEVKRNDPRIKIDNLQGLTHYRDLWTNLIADVGQASEAIDPQQATIDANPGGLEGLPAPERRRVYIASVRSLYQPSKASRGEGEDQQQQMDPYGGMMGPGGGGMGPGGMGGMPMGPAAGGVSVEAEALGKTTDPEQFFTDEGDGPPQFVITVRGTTPYRDASRLLEKQFNQTLKQPGQDRARPYRTLSVELSELSQAYRPNLEEDEEDGRSRRFDGRSGRRRPSGGAPGGSQGPPAEMMRQMEQMGGMTGSSGNVGEWSTYLPQDPLKQERETQVRDFTVKWTIQLLPPGQTDQGQDQPQQPENQPQEAAAPTPAGDPAGSGEEIAS